MNTCEYIKGLDEMHLIKKYETFLKSKPYVKIISVVKVYENSLLVTYEEVNL